MELTAIAEAAAIALALAYVALAARGSLWCWPPAFLSSLVFVVLTLRAKLAGEVFINSFYMLMAVYGYWQWRFGGKGRAPLPITEWRGHLHLAHILLGIAASLLLGVAFEHGFGSAMPYLDALSTVFSLSATFMVTRRVLSNWLYWIGIDVLNAFLYFNRGLKPTAMLFVLYAIIAIWGFWKWREEWKSSGSVRW